MSSSMAKLFVGAPARRNARARLPDRARQPASQLPSAGELRGGKMNHSAAWEIRTAVAHYAPRQHMFLACVIIAWTVLLVCCISFARTALQTLAARHPSMPHARPACRSPVNSSQPEGPTSLSRYLGAADAHETRAARLQWALSVATRVSQSSRRLRLCIDGLPPPTSAYPPKLSLLQVLPLPEVYAAQCIYSCSLCLVSKAVSRFLRPSRLP